MQWNIPDHPAMPTIKHLLDRNRAWAETLRARRPDFFAELAEQQDPRYLWIGCSDSRVPATDILDLTPGELFVHRNVANVVVPTDLNCLSELQSAVGPLMVELVLGVGHPGDAGKLLRGDDGADGGCYLAPSRSQHAGYFAHLRQRAFQLLEVGHFEGERHPRLEVARQRIDRGDIDLLARKDFGNVAQQTLPVHRVDDDVDRKYFRAPRAPIGGDEAF